MAKYYVQSGSMRSVVQAETGKKAALWAVHQVMKQVLPMEDMSNESDNGSTPVTVLSGTVKVAERGFDRDDAKELSTMEVVAEWNQMVTTLDRLERLLYQSA